jgi:hypothetical protein
MAGDSCNHHGRQAKVRVIEYVEKLSIDAKLDPTCPFSKFKLPNKRRA